MVKCHDYSNSASQSRSQSPLLPGNEAAWSVTKSMPKWESIVWPLKATFLKRYCHYFKKNFLSFVFCLLSFYLYGKLRATRPKHKNIQFTSPITYGEHHGFNLRSGSLPADVFWGSFVTHSFLPHKRTKDVCGEASDQAVLLPFLFWTFTLYPKKE